MQLPVSFVYLLVFGLLTRLSKAWFMWGSNENVISKQRILKDVEGYPGGLD